MTFICAGRDIFSSENYNRATDYMDEWFLLRFNTKDCSSNSNIHADILPLKKSHVAS